MSMSRPGMCDDSLTLQAHAQDLDTDKAGSHSRRAAMLRNQASPCFKDNISTPPRPTAFAACVDETRTVFAPESPS